MKKPLVTILSPVYNGGSYIQRFIESIISQTYDNIYLIIVNDGSTDSTEEIIFSNREKIEEKYKFKYIYQDNKGQASAINNGLKYIEGDYLIWPDSDDMLTENSVEKKVEFLEKNPDYGLVRTNYSAVSEKDLAKILYEIKPKNNKKNIFEDILMEETYCTNGAYMLRISSFLEVNPQKDIYISKGGQNWQMLLPITYSFKCGYIDISSYIYVIREKSHSRQSDGNFENELERNLVLKDILLKTIKTIDLDYEKYEEMIENKYLIIEMILGKKYKNKTFAKERYMKLKAKKKLKTIDKLFYYLGKNKFTNFILKISKNINRRKK